MRRLFAFVVALILAIAFPAVAAGNAPSRFSTHTVSINCDGLAGSAGTLFMGLAISNEFGTDASLDVWSGVPYVGVPDLTRDYDLPVSVSLVGASLSASIPLLDGRGQPAGSATVSANLSPIGPPSKPESFRDANSWTKVSGTLQPLAVSGSVTLPRGQVYSLAPCFGEEDTLDFFVTNPSASVRSFAFRGVNCALANTAGDTGFLSVGIDDTSVYIAVYLTPSDGSLEVQGFGGAPVVGGAVSALIQPLFNNFGEPVAGAAALSMTLTATGERFTYTLRNATGFRRISSDLIDIEGSLTFPGRLPFDLGACVGQDTTVKDVRTSPAGPKPGGKVPANDKPSGAILLKPGSRTATATKGASPDQEAPYDCLTFDFGDGPFSIPVGNTVWYKVAGTGGSITVDTAGSDYDTVAAVYTPDGSSGYTPLPGACNDDVPLVPFGRTLQSAVTFATSAGVTYYVQIGGFPESFAYGTLKVAVR